MAGGRSRQVALHVLVVSILVSVGCSPCSDDKSREWPSPDKKFVAVSYIRDCGASTDLSTHVAIRPTSWYSRDSDSSIVFVIKGIADIGVTWQDSSHVTVQYQGGRVFRALTEHDGVSIKYQSGTAR